MDSLSNINLVSPTVIQSSPLAIVVIDMDRKVLLWNPAASVIFGWTEEEVLGRLMPTDSVEQQAEFAEILSDVKSGRPTFLRRTRRRRKDGVIIDVSMSVAPLHDGAGKTVGLIGIIADITEHVQAEELYKTMASSSYAGVYVVQRGIFRFINKNAAAYAGYTPEEMTGLNSLSIIHPDDKALAAENAALMLKGLRSSPYEFRVITKEGRVRWIMETVTPIYFEGDRAVLGNSMDVTERLQMEEALRQSEERYRTILENIEDGYYEVDLKGKFLFFNEACEGMFGFTKEEMLRMNYRQMGDTETAKKVFQIFNRVYVTGKPETGVEWEVVRKEGDKGHIEASVSLIRNRDGEPTGFRGIIRDITTRKEAERAITHLAYHDPVTGLPNRILFNDRLSISIAQSQRKKLKFALFVLDLDGFKDVNDTHGHSAGDRLLRRVGERLRTLVRKSDTIARMGGDEFLILLQEISDTDNSILIARKILKAFQKPFKFDNLELLVTTSIGIAVYPDDGGTGEILMKHADAALYRAKREGRNQYRNYLPLLDDEVLI